MPPKARSKLAVANRAGKQPRLPARPLVAALAVLRRDGPTGLTLRAVAEEGGFSNPAIYRHYENKEALIRDVIREIYGVFKSYLFEAIDVVGERERLLAALDAGCQFALDHPYSYELLFFTPHRLVIDRYPDDFRRGKSPGFRFLVEGVEGCMRAGVLQPGDATDAALSLVAHMHGLVILHQTGRFNDDPALFRKFYRRSMESLLTGMSRRRVSNR